MKLTFKIDQEAVRAVKARLAELGKRTRAVRQSFSLGIHSKEGAQPAKAYDGSEGPASILAVALIHEFGAGRVPDRSFVRAWFDSNLERLKREATIAVRLEFRSGQAGAVRALAERWLNELRSYITDGGHLAPLSPATEHERARRGLPTSPPLHATGTLVDAIRLVFAGDE